MRGHIGPVNAAVFSSDESVLVTAGADKTIRLWKVENGQELQILYGHSKSVDTVDFSPDGRALISVDVEGAEIIWNLDLDSLMVKSCDWLRDYMANPATPAEDKALCEGYLPTQPLLGRIPWVNNVIGFWQGVLQRNDKLPQT